MKMCPPPVFCESHESGQFSRRLEHNFRYGINQDRTFWWWWSLWIREGGIQPTTSTFIPSRQCAQWCLYPQYLIRVDLRSYIPLCLTDIWLPTPTLSATAQPPPILSVFKPGEEQACGCAYSSIGWREHLFIPYFTLDPFNCILHFWQILSSSLPKILWPDLMEEVNGWEGSRLTLSQLLTQKPNIRALYGWMSQKPLGYQTWPEYMYVAARNMKPRLKTILNLHMKNGLSASGVICALFQLSGKRRLKFMILRLSSDDREAL